METKKYSVLNEAEIVAENTYDIGELSPFAIGIPLLDISDPTIRKIYYYRWHSFCSHIKMTPLGYIVTEFTPSVPWEGIYGSIVCPAGHHLYEGRWLHDGKYIDGYARFWFREGANPRLYSTWLADSIYAVCKVSGDFKLAEDLYDDLKKNYAAWEAKNRMDNYGNLLYQIDDIDGMEFSASGNGCRPTINSYQYGDAVALSKIADRLGKQDEKAYYENEYQVQKEKVDRLLWDQGACFYKNKKNGYWLCDVREMIGYIPWYFLLPDEDKNAAWKFLFDEKYFYTPYGPTTAEKGHHEFMRDYPYMCCLWNGPSWPFATSQTLTALANFLCNYHQDVVGKKDYFRLLKVYANSQHDITETGERIPYIGESLDPFTGEWFTRKKMIELDYDEANQKREIHYNHSSFCDLVISGLAGVRARDDDKLEVDPLFEENDLDYFCLDGVQYQGHYLTVLWDKTGERYHRGAGLKFYVDGNLRAERPKLEKIISDPVCHKN